MSPSDVAAAARLAAEADRVLRAGVYASTVVFVQSLGFITSTAARRISLADSLAFEEVHRRTYTEPGFRLVNVPPGMCQRDQVNSGRLYVARIYLIMW